MQAIYLAGGCFWGPQRAMDWVGFTRSGLPMAVVSTSVTGDA